MSKPYQTSLDMVGEPLPPFLEGVPYIHKDYVDLGRPKKVVAAAVLYKGKLWTGRRHWDIAVEMEGAGEISDAWAVPEEAKGFIGDTGLFMTRKAAAATAIRFGQIPREHTGMLTSEHLW